ncbi:MAG: 1-acyl-sn-glycerol-3-phosphate acyltransferase [Alkalispirochaetaceae bacterium]
MSRRNYGATGGLPFLEPRYSRFAHALVRHLSPIFLKLLEGISEVSVQGGATLIEEYRRFGEGESRLIVAFRHPSASDAPLVGYLFGRRIQQVAKANGVRLPRRTLVHFLYGRGVPLWSGPGTGWLLPRIAAIPVYQRRVDSRGMAAVRAAVVEGRFPIALAPEGQVTYHNKSFGSLEGGTGRIALWAKSDLEKLGISSPVRILPLSIEYRFGDRAGPTLDRVLQWIEAKTGIPGAVDHRAPGPEIHEALLSLTEQLVGRLEGMYAPFFKRSATPSELPDRIDRVCNTALRVGERSHGILGTGTLLDRVFRLRDAGWKRMFRDDLEGLSPVERGFADAFAEQAKLSARHMELVDALEYLDPSYISPESDLDRFLEYTLVLQDVVNRLLGGTIAGRMKVRGREAVVKVGTPKSVAELLTAGTGGSAAAGSGLSDGTLDSPESQSPGAEALLLGRDASRRITEYVAREFARLIE